MALQVKKSEFKVGANYHNTYFEGQDLSELNLTNCDLSDCAMFGTNLQKSILIGADLNCTKLNYANLSGADLSQCDLSFTNFFEAKLVSTNLTNSLVIYTDFSYTNLTNANLTDLNITKGIFANANLKDVNFKGSYIYGANFCDANFEGSNIHECEFDHTKKLEQNIAIQILTDIRLGNFKLTYKGQNDQIHPIVKYLYDDIETNYFEASKIVPTLGLFFYDSEYTIESIVKLLKLVATGQLSIYDKHSVSNYQKTQKKALFNAC